MPKTLLLADDSPTIRKIVELTFADSDIRVRTMPGGGDVVTALESLRPDVVLADVGLSEPDGYELCRRVKASSRPVPVGLLVGTFDRVDADRLAECGADGRLGKPFDAAALVTWVHDLLSAEESGDARGGRHEDPAHVVAPREAPAVARAAEPAPGSGELSEALVEAVARRVLERLSADVVREMAREIIPEVATEIVEKRIRELEKESE